MTDWSETEPKTPRSDSELLEVTLQKPDVHERWEHAFRTPENARFYDLAFDYVTVASGAPQGAMFLDAGCGIGDYTVRLAKRGMRVVAVDFSESALQMARKNVGQSGFQDRIILRRENILCLGFADETFDAALCWGVLMHIPEVERAIAELARVVRRGGVVVVSEGNMFSVQSVVIRALKRLLRRDCGQARRTPAGLEDWTTTSAGTLLTREADVCWLIQEFTSAGFTLKQRVAGQFTELYSRASSLLLTHFIHWFNRLWFSHVHLPHPAYGNILILERHP